MNLDGAVLDSQFTLVLLSGIAVAAMIGVGVVGRLSRETVLWASSFFVAMMMAATIVAASATNSRQVVWAAIGLAFVPAGLIWSGFRTRRGVAAHWVWVLGAALLIASFFFVFSPTWSSGQRLSAQILMYCAEMAFYVLLAVEMLKAPDRDAPILRPLFHASWIIPVMGVIVFLFWANTALTDSTVNGYLARFMTEASGVFVVCALTSLAGLTAPRRKGSPDEDSPQDSFPARAQSRLHIAQQRNEVNWSFIVVRLDDAADLRAAGGTTALGVIGDRLEEVVGASFPSWAETSRHDAVSIHVLCPGSLAMVRNYVARTLRMFMEDQQRLPLSMTHSASAGWASVETQGYEMDELLAVAEDCLQVAAENGGDRWERR